MTAAEFKKKWQRYQGKETSAYQSHFDDLCRLLGQPTPNEADPSGSDFFCFQKRVVKDAELFEMHETPDASEPTERGFADVWKKGCFAWEYKGKKKNLDEAYKQLLRYREALENPPLLVVCDFDRYIVKTNFNGTVQEVHEFTNAEIDAPKNLRILRALFENPDFLKPQRTMAQVTKDLAAQIAEIAKSLQSRESVELADAKSRKEVNVAQKKNLRIARFLNRIVFCFFAEDTGLLPKNLFTEIAKTGIDDPKHFAESLEKLFAVMATGGTFGKDKIRYFNGHLFEEASVFELTEAELRQLADAGLADWQFIEPSIMGTLFERALEPEQRSQLGAHYTSEADIKTLVEPVLMQPFRREWAKIKGELAVAFAKGKGNAAQKDQLAKFQKKLAAVTVLDPACGSGNFLYVSLQLPNSDVIKPSWNGVDLTRRPRDGWIIDFGTNISQERAALYEKPFQFVLENVKPERDQNNREMYRKFWWRHGEPRIAMRENLSRLKKFIATSEVAKHRTFAWLPIEILPDKRLIVFAREDDATFGILQSRLHEVWSLKLGSTLEDRPCYRLTTCFETFPFPRPTPKQEAAIAAAAQELNALRERWLNPPEWTVEKILEFPGSVDGPWARYIVDCGDTSPLSPARHVASNQSADMSAHSKIGLVRYPRLEPRDADCAAKLKDRTLTKLYNERMTKHAWLDFAHKKLDAAVAAAYGFPADLTDEQILEKLLALNLERAAEEAKAAKVKKPKVTRAKSDEEMI